MPILYIAAMERVQTCTNTHTPSAVATTTTINTTTTTAALVIRIGIRSPTHVILHNSINNKQNYPPLLPYSCLYIYTYKHRRIKIDYAILYYFFLWFPETIYVVG